MTFTHTMLSFQGRLRRRDLWIYWIGLLVVAATLFVLLERLLGLDLTEHRSWILTLLTVWPSYALLAKRMHDRNRSAWWALLLLGSELAGHIEAMVGFPRSLSLTSDVVGILVLLWVFIDFGLLEGTPGDNRFGPSPKAPREPSPSETPAVA